MLEHHPALFMKRGAALSACGAYRYALSRWWREPAAPRTIMFVMLNPSTADADIDDPTIRRCVGFAQAWGYDGLFVGNVFAYRSTDPAGLHEPRDAIGPENRAYLELMARSSERIVCAWGSKVTSVCKNAPRIVKTLGRPLYCFGLTKSGQPLHPLYLPADAKLTEYRPA